MSPELCVSLLDLSTAVEDLSMLVLKVFASARGLL